MKKTNILFVLLSASIVFSSCGAVIKSYIRKDDANMPPGYGKQVTTLLVLEQEKKAYNRKIEKLVKKYYTGDYTFVSAEQLKRNPYSDTVKYRYLLNDHVTYSSYTTFQNTPMRAGTSNATMSIGQKTTAGGASYRIHDRKENKIYDTEISSGASWKAVLKAYLKKLDADRMNSNGQK